MKKLTNSQLQKKVWEQCKRIIRERYNHDCYTCNARNLEGSNLQTGHMIAKGSLPLRYKYDLNLLRPQCMRCNIHNGGMGAYFVKRWEAEGNNFEELERKIKQEKPMSSLEAWIYLNDLLELLKTL